MSKYFINVTNHDSKNWSDKQTDVATNYGKIIDMGFPAVDPDDSSSRIRAAAINIVKNIINQYGFDFVALVQGEMTFTYALVNEFKRNGITCLAATSKRKSVEKTQPDGTTTKISVFEFVQFREY